MWTVDTGWWKMVFSIMGNQRSGTLTFCSVSESTPEVQNVRQTTQVGELCCSMFQRLCDSVGIRYPEWM